MKQIYDYINYFIDEQGNVFNSLTNKNLKGSIGENGYRYYRLSKNNEKKMFYAHRLVAEHYLENPNNLPIVNHIDGNKLNNDVNNLEWISYSDNSKHWHVNSSVTRKTTEYYTEDLENEQWVEFQNYYVSSCGRVRRKKKNNLLRPSVASGYYKVRLSNEGITQDYLIHKLVFQLFGNETLDDTKVIDHIDGNKLNNNINNLRQITIKDNVKAAFYETKTNSNIKPVAQYDKENNLLNTFVSIKDAALKLNLDASTISKVCRGINKSHGGFIFKYL